MRTGSFFSSHLTQLWTIMWYARTPSIHGLKSRWCGRNSNIICWYISLYLPALPPINTAVLNSCYFIIPKLYAPNIWFHQLKFQEDWKSAKCWLIHPMAVDNEGNVSSSVPHSAALFVFDILTYLMLQLMFISSPSINEWEVGWWLTRHIDEGHQSLQSW